MFVFLVVYSSYVVYKIIKDPKCYEDHFNESIRDHMTMLLILLVIVKVSSWIQLRAGIFILRKKEVTLTPAPGIMAIINIIILIAILIVITPKLWTGVAIGFQVVVLIVSVIMT